jgi:hypothetical protein
MSIISLANSVRQDTDPGQAALSAVRPGKRIGRKIN